MTVLRPILVVFIGFTLGACSASNMVGGSARDEDRVLRTDNTMLQSRLAVVDTRTRYNNDLLQVQATLRNQWKFELDFQYRIKWFDADGFEIDREGQAWRQLVLPGTSEANVQGVAPNSKAQRFEIWVQE